MKRSKCERPTASKPLFCLWQPWIIATLLTPVTACTTIENLFFAPSELSSTDAESSESTEYTPFIHYQAPWPQEATLWQKSFQDGDLVAMTPAVKIWDFNGDGRPEVVATLDATGQATSWNFDFDLDGKVDTSLRPKP